MQPVRRGREHVPAPFLLHKRKEVTLSFYYELQCNSPLGLHQFLVKRFISPVKNHREVAKGCPCEQPFCASSQLLSYFLSSTSTYSASMTPSSFLAWPSSDGPAPAPGVGPAPGPPCG